MQEGTPRELMLPRVSESTHVPHPYDGDTLLLPLKGLLRTQSKWLSDTPPNPCRAGYRVLGPSLRVSHSGAVEKGPAGDLIQVTLMLWGQGPHFENHCSL